jgi:hypothetical protein
MTRCERRTGKYLLVSRPAPIRGHGRRGGEEKRGVGGKCTALSLFITVPPVVIGNSGTCHMLIMALII